MCIEILLNVVTNVEMNNLGTHTWLGSGRLSVQCPPHSLLFEGLQNEGPVEMQSSLLLVLANVE